MPATAPLSDSPRAEAIGRERSPLLIVDRASGDPAAVARTATALGPFPPADGNAYPGLRRTIGPEDQAAATYAFGLLRRIAPAINRVFDTDGFDLLSASFSVVTTPRDALAPIQRAPHFDSTDPLYLAVLHYLSGTAGSGTAFFRQRATGIERITPANRGAFLAAAGRESGGWDGYIQGSNGSFEEIARVAAEPDRLIVYPGSLLHSGIIPPDLPLNTDPAAGRLTANLFVRGRPRAGQATRAR